MLQLQYQSTFEVPWFEEPSALQAEDFCNQGIIVDDTRVNGFYLNQDNPWFEEPSALEIYSHDGDLIERIHEAPYENEEWMHPDTVVAMPDYFEFDGLDFLEPEPTIDLGEEAPSELYTLLPYQNTLEPKQFNFGKPYSPGRYGIKGQYICPHTPTSSSLTLVADTVYYIPIPIPYNMRFKELGCYITTRDDVNQAIIGLYSSQRGEIIDLIHSGTINLNSTAYVAFEVDIWLTEGVYFLAILSNSSTARLKSGYSSESEFALAFKKPDDCADDGLYYQMYTQSQLYTDGLPEVIDMEDLTLSLEQGPTIIAKLGN